MFSVGRTGSSKVGKSLALHLRDGEGFWFGFGVEIRSGRK